MPVMTGIDEASGYGATMGTVSTLPGSAVLTALLTQPTATVAGAVRTGAAAVAEIALAAEVLEQLRAALLAATGRPEWQLEHLRDPRPLGEVLEVSRLIFEQRRVLIAA